MDKLRNNLIAVYGNRGQEWFSALPDFISTIEKKLGIIVEVPFNSLGVNYVAPARFNDGGFSVFKCSLPNKELTNEIAALKYYAGKGAVDLIFANADEGWMLIEYCEPGKMLSSIENDEQAIVIAIEVMQRLWKPIIYNHEFPTISKWLQGLDRLQTFVIKAPNLVPSKLIDFAIHASKELLASAGEPVLLHGDLHHHNILSSKRGSWLAIDPKGVVGEREYETGCLMRNPMPQLLQEYNVKKTLKNRLDQMVELTGFDRQRLLYWSIVQAVLAGWWRIEDKIVGEKYMFACAALLHEIINEI